MFELVDVTVPSVYRTTLNPLTQINVDLTKHLKTSVEDMRGLTTWRN